MPEAIVQVVFQDRIIETARLEKEVTSIGRLPENDITLPNLGVSRHHCRIVKNEEGQYFIEDNESANGTFVNGIKIKRTRIYSGDEIYIGKHKIIFQITTKGVAGIFKDEEKKADLWVGDSTIYTGVNPPPPAPAEEAGGRATQAESKPDDNTPPDAASAGGVPPAPPVKPVTTIEDLREALDGHSHGVKVLFEDKVVGVHGLGKGEATIGRDKSNDINIDNLAVSRKHAHIIYHDGQYVAEDLDSSNGIRINGISVKRSVLYPGDEISIGKHTLVFNTSERLLAGVSTDDIRRAVSSAQPWQTGTYFDATSAPEQAGTIDESTGEEDVERAPWDGKYSVRVVLDDRQVASYILTRQVSCIGRLAENDIVIDNIGVSRLHARIIIEDNGQCYIEDEDSANGILVNGLPVKRSPLYPGDQIQIVKHKIIFDLAHKSPPDQKAAEGGKMSKEAWRLDQTFAISNKEQEKKIKEWAERAARLKAQRARKLEELKKKAAIEGEKTEEMETPPPSEPESQPLMENTPHWWELEKAKNPAAPPPEPPATESEAARDRSDKPQHLVEKPFETTPVDYSGGQEGAGDVPRDEVTPTPELSKYSDENLEEESTGEADSSAPDVDETEPSLEKGPDELADETRMEDSEPVEEKAPVEEDGISETVGPPARLIFDDGGEVYVNKPEFILGSGDEVDLMYEGKGIKDKHAVIYRTSVGWKINAKGLFGKITINGKKYKSKVLQEDDEITIGGVPCRFSSY